LILCGLFLQTANKSGFVNLARRVPWKSRTKDDLLGDLLVRESRPTMRDQFTGLYVSACDDDRHDLLVTVGSTMADNRRLVDLGVLAKRRLELAGPWRH
jgi:hypothetical protein